MYTGFGREIPNNIAKCPKTFAIIETVKEKFGFDILTAAFSAIDHDTWV